MKIAANPRGNINIVSFTGSEVKDLIPEIARLRIEVFYEYPFLYKGDPDYEIRYLNKFQIIKDAIVVCAFDQQELIGLATGFPFIYEADNLKETFIANHREPKEYFCLGESILRQSYRGLGIGKQFIKELEAHVKRLKTYPYICFYTIIRPADHPQRPPEYRPLTTFWQSHGYQEHLELTGTISYQEIGEPAETPKKMVFWIKKI